MSFFEGSQNVRISGGQFNIIRGNVNVHDESRHHTNVNSGNTTSTKWQDSLNDHSTNYDNVDPRKMPPLQQQGQRDQGKSDPGNDRDFFPPPAPNPMLHPQNLPPGSRTENHNSLNTNFEHYNNIRNDYSRNYGPHSAKAHGRRTSPLGPTMYPQMSSNGRFREGNAFFGPSAVPPHPYSPSATFDSQSHQPNVLPRRYNIPGPPPTSLPYVNGRRPGPHLSADLAPGDVLGFTPEMQATFSQLMQQVNNTVARDVYDRASMASRSRPMMQPPYRAPQPYSGSDVAEEDSESEEEREEQRMQDRLAGGMAHLSLNEDLRPAFSRNKSDPELPQQTETYPETLHVPYIDPRHAESNQDLPQRLREPFVVDPSYAYAPPQYEQGRQAPPQPSPLIDIPASFGLHPSSLQGTPIFNDIHGDYNKFDNSVHNTNIDSFNTRNTLVRDSYNNHSMNVNSAEEQNERKSAKKQGHIPRRF